MACAEAGTFTTFPSHSVDHSSWIVRDVNPGGTYQEFITLQNLSNQNITLEIEIMESSGNQENIKLLENLPLETVGLWIKPEINKINLKAKEHRQIKFEIQVPSDTVPNEYQAVALVSEQGNSENPIKIQTRIGNRFYLNVTNSNDLKTNTFTPNNHELQIGLIILSLGGLVYGFMPSKKHLQKK